MYSGSNKTTDYTDYTDFFFDPAELSDLGNKRKTCVICDEENLQT